MKRKKTVEEFEIVNHKVVVFGDLYHYLLRAPWWLDFLLIAVGFVIANLIFACVYTLVGGVANASTFADCFNFSVQTMGTIGYGNMYPTSVIANQLVTVESVVGIVVVALATGLVFSKFSVPRARVRFSTNAVIHPLDGVPTLVIRAGNARGNEIVEAQVRVSLVRTERSREGILLYRMYDLELVRDRSPAFSRTWLVMHQIKDASPLAGTDAEWLKRNEVELMVTLTGIDGTSAQTMHARHRYLDSDVLWNMRHADMLSELPDGRFRLDVAQFDAVVPMATENG